MATAKGFATNRIYAVLLSFSLEVAGTMHRMRERKIAHNLSALDRKNYVIPQLALSMPRIINNVLPSLIEDS